MCKVSMKNTVIILLSILSSSVFGESKNYECTEHNSSLLIKSIGFEHVNHQPLINGEIVISELVDAMWFIEEVSCSKLGFDITASHSQYNDPTKMKFRVVVNSDSTYEIR